MHRAIVLLLVMGLGIGPLHAGAWPRGEGNHFLSTTMRVAASTLDGPFFTYNTFYYEYGLTDRITIGTDLGRAVSGEIKAIAYARLPILQGSGRNKIAIEIGFGTIAGNTVVRPGLSLGRGINTRWGHGWLALESVAEIAVKTNQVDYKADFTIGVDVRPKIKLIMQLQTGAPSGDPYFARLASSVVVKISRKSHIELGMTTGLVSDNQIGLKIGMWREF